MGFRDTSGRVLPMVRLRIQALRNLSHSWWGHWREPGRSSEQLKPRANHHHTVTLDRKKPRGDCKQELPNESPPGGRTTADPDFQASPHLRLPTASTSTSTSGSSELHHSGWCRPAPSGQGPLTKCGERATQNRHTLPSSHPSGFHKGVGMALNDQS